MGFNSAFKGLRLFVLVVTLKEWIWERGLRGRASLFVGAPLGNLAGG